MGGTWSRGCRAGGRDGVLGLVKEQVGRRGECAWGVLSYQYQLNRKMQRWSLMGLHTTARVTINRKGALDVTRRVICPYTYDISEISRDAATHVGTHVAKSYSGLQYSLELVHEHTKCPQ